MSGTRIPDMPDLGAVTDGASFVGESAGSGRFQATALQAYVGASVGNSIGRNLLHNSLFNIQQRGTGPFTAVGLTLDRWKIALVGDTMSVSAAAQTDAGRAQIGDEASAFTLQATVTGGSSAGNYSAVSQTIESVGRLSGKTVTVSFYAFSAQAIQIGVNLLQSFGTGGSPSASVWAQVTGAAVTTSATWQRFSVTIAVPSISGKTLGLNNDGGTQLWLWLSSGATNSAPAGNVGVQSGTVNFWGMQVEVGSTATPLAKPDPRYELANCQRFYQNGSGRFVYYQQAGAGGGYRITLAMPMRASPTVTSNFTTQTNCSGSTFGAADTQTVDLFGGTATATGTVVIVGNFSASADL